LRLHVFLPGYFDRPHDHRWTYASRIMHGSYTHVLYGTGDRLNDEEIDVAALLPRMVRTETAADFYVLYYSMIHSVTAEPHTTSLIVRGPEIRDRFMVTGRAWWQHSAATEPAMEAAAKRMTAGQAAACVERLVDQGVLA
jgi:hypothetical protein